MSDDYAKRIFASIKVFEKDLGIHRGFFNKLLKEDDWSFIIKLHSLFEAAVTHLLTKELNKNELENVISELELSNKKSGKLAFARSLNLLSKKESRYINSLSELRNKLVHKIVNVNFNLEDHVQSLDSQQLNSFASSFGFVIKKDFEFKGRKLHRNQFSKESPKITIWIGALACLDLVQA